jgi:gliding motility-associated-like protein
MKLTGAAPWKIKYDRNSTFLNEVATSSSLITVTDSPVTGIISETYTYSIFSVEDVNGCISEINSGSKKATVYKVPSAVAGNDTSVCGNKVTLKSKPSVGYGKWQFPLGVTVSADSDPNATFTVDSVLFNNGKIINRFYWKESNWQCSSQDSIDVTFYKRVLKINAGQDTTLYSFDNTFHPVNNTPESWEYGAWEIISGSGIFGDDAISDLSEGLNSYKWTISNGKMQNGVIEEGCSVSDILNVEVRTIEIPEGFSPNNDIDGFNNTFVIRGLDLPNQIAELKIISSAGTEVFSTSNNEGGTWADWDGKNSKGSDMPEGTYYYLLKIISKNNNSVFKRSGFLILKRY